ncbi:MAG: protease complex subunit PrcB family protein [Clostridiales bacterium]|nr:protease complex subunit PrcB family protein [Clostridiales bacterium]
MAGMVLVLLAGCGMTGEKTDKIRDLEFTVVGEERQPEELKKILEEKKAEEFKMTYTDQEYLYICIGYGEQATGGYSITVNELYLTENAVYVSTNLIGPAPEEKKEGTSYPYIVLKTENVDKSVVFD